MNQLYLSVYPLQRRRWIQYTSVVVFALLFYFCLRSIFAFYLSDQYRQIHAYVPYCAIRHTPSGIDILDEKNLYVVAKSCQELMEEYRVTQNKSDKYTNGIRRCNCIDMCTAVFNNEIFLICWNSRYILWWITWRVCEWGVEDRFFAGGDVGRKEYNLFHFSCTVTFLVESCDSFIHMHQGCCTGISRPCARGSTEEVRHGSTFNGKGQVVYSCKEYYGLQQSQRNKRQGNTSRGLTLKQHNAI